MSSRYFRAGLVISSALVCTLLSVVAQQPPVPPSAEPRKLPPEIVERVRTELMDDADLQDCLQDENEEPADIEEVLSAETINLGSGHEGMVVRGSGDCLCGPSGNCEVWLFEIAGGVPRLLLRASAVQEVTLKESASNGYRDLVTSMRASGGDADLSVYQFDGKEYRLKQCLRLTWNDDQGRRLKQPRVLAGSCEAQGKQ